MEGPAMIVTVILGGLIALYALKKLGDFKDILIIILIFVFGIALFYVLPALQENPLFPAIDEFVRNLPQIMGEIWKRFTGGT